MKHTLYISFLVASTLILLAFTMVPHHHHHGRMFCLVMERCEQDGAVNDEHTGHEDSGEGETNCIIETCYVVSEDGDESVGKVLSPERHHPEHFSPAICHWAGAPVSDAGKPSLRSGYGAYIVLYTSATASRLNGLRAPPRG